MEEKTTSQIPAIPQDEGQETDFVGLSLRLPAGMKERMERHAKADDRPVSIWARRILAKVMDAIEAGEEGEE